MHVLHIHSRNNTRWEFAFQCFSWYSLAYVQRRSKLPREYKNHGNLLLYHVIPPAIILSCFYPCLHEQVGSKTVELVADTVWVCLDIRTFLQILTSVCSVWSISSTTGPCPFQLAMYRAVFPSCTIIYTSIFIWLCVYLSLQDTTWHSPSVCNAQRRPDTHQSMVEFCTNSNPELNCYKC